MFSAYTPNLICEKRLDKEVTDDSRRLDLGFGPIRRRRSERSASFKRLLKVAQALTQHPEASIPQATGTWGDAKAAYRLLNEADVTPDALQQPHRNATIEQCAALPLVLAVQDASDLDYTFHNKTKGLGKIGDSKGRGLMQQTCLAVDPQKGQAIGLLHQSWHKRVERDPEETARQRLARWRESDIWADTIRAIGSLRPRSVLPPGRIVHVMDSHGDCFSTFVEARRQDAELIARVMHYDRKLIDGTNLTDYLSAQPVMGTMEVILHEQRDGRNCIKHEQRTAKLEARAAAVTLPPPQQGNLHEQLPIVLNGILLKEVDVPPGAQAVMWMILTSLPISTFQQVQQVVKYYAFRWRIEEFHRVEKEGCAVEEAQFDDATDLMRLASIKSVIAVRLLQLRDVAQEALSDPKKLDTPKRLAQIVPASWIAVVAALAKIEASKLKVSQFYRRVAMRGGWLGRKSDGPPGWKTLWRGWSELWWIVQGYEIAQTLPARSG